MRTLALLTLVPIFVLSVPAKPLGQTDAKATATAWIDGNADTLRRINRNIWTWAETGLEETKSSAELQKVVSGKKYLTLIPDGQRAPKTIR